METLEIVFITLAITFLIIFVISSMLIVDYLNKKGVKINFVLLRLMIIPYADQYRKLTKKENGKTGKAYYVWLGSVNLALLCIILRFVI
jgi:hypothetical protein